MTDFRALCAELVDIATAHCHPDDDAVGYCAAVLGRARAALAQPEPQGPTDEELMALAVAVFEDTFSTDKDYGRAVLALWGRPAIEPVPVSERLPGPEDCDKEGCCWWWDYGQDSWSQGMPEYCINRHIHWLPHWALPVPKREGEQ